MERRQLLVASRKQSHQKPKQKPTANKHGRLWFLIVQLWEMVLIE
ncbi:hypothetical protein HMPREF1586_00872 [Gardnerella vaginalis JCP8522]|nr:hypothetical protein HMPREF1586_00872 [Gardnerella vaginalis JCP8522]